MYLPPLLFDKTLTLAENVYQVIKQGILSYDIKPREYLVIGDIAKVYKISRTPVREALIRLESEGWVESDGRRGVKVTVPSADRVLQIAEVQAVLEAYVARRAAETFTDEDIVRAEKILDEMKETMLLGGREQARLVGVKFHRFLAEKTGNQYLNTTICELEQTVSRVTQLIWHGDAPIEKSHQQHQEILNAIKERDAARAERLMFQHTTWYEEELKVALRHL